MSGEKKNSDFVSAFLQELQRNQQEKREAFERLPIEEQSRIQLERAQAEIAKKREQEARKYRKYLAAFRECLVRDWWTIEEFANLLHGELPEYDPLFLPGDIERTRTTVERCVGESLATKREEDWLESTIYVRAKDCLAWPEGRMKPHRYWTDALAELRSPEPARDGPDAAESPIVAPAPQSHPEGSDSPPALPRGRNIPDTGATRKRTTEAARQAKDNKIRERRTLLAEFREQIVELATAQGLEIEIDCLPVTKQEFRDEFYRFAHRKSPELKRVAAKTIATEAKDLGTGFKHGTKRCPNNLLRRLFNGRKPT